MSEIPDLLERFRRGAELLAVTTTGAAGPELDFKPEGKWSVRQIVCHLADAEAVAAMRLRQLIAEDNPQMMAWDQNAWTARLDYDKRKISQLLEIFRVMRASNYELLKDLPAETYARTGTHSERGLMSLLQMLTLCTEHTEKHTSQIRGVRAAYKEHRAKSAPAAS
jgi:DinB superfamily